MSSSRALCSLFIGIFAGAALIAPAASLAESESAAPMPSRWTDPTHARQPHAPVVWGPSVGKAQTEARRNAGRGGVELAIPRGRIAIIVNSTIYNAVSASLATYSNDLALAGFSSITVSFTGNAEFLRNTLIALYQEPESLAGAVFVGTLPHVIFEMNQNWGNGDEYEDFPCDMYFMDMDGTWSDTLNASPVQAGNGKLDTWAGNTGIEIWVSRMQTANLTSLGSETALLNQYLARNHSQRWDVLNNLHTGLVYNDDDWKSMGPNDTAGLEHTVGAGHVTAVTDPEATTVADYKASRMTGSYHIDVVRSHGSPYGHGFYKNSRQTFEYLPQADYLAYDPVAAFYSLFICSGCDYSISNNLGGTIVFNPAGGTLLVWGSTKTGGMYNEGTFYDRIAGGDSIGLAFKYWFNSVRSSSIAPQWWYGMVLIGDASCHVSTGIPTPVLGDLDHDFEVDFDDLAIFTTCASGPAVPHSNTAICRPADFDSDGDIDQNDFGLFQQYYTNLGCPPVTIGNGSLTWDFPLYTYFHDSRTQVIYLASEIGGRGRITSLALNVMSLPGQPLNNWTIRMKHTSLNEYATAAFEADGWTVVYQANEPVGSTGWRIFDFSTPFEYDGSSNLMIDFSHNNSSYTIEGHCAASQSGGIRSAYAFTDSGRGDPLTWSGTTSVFSSSYVPDLQLSVCPTPE